LVSAETWHAVKFADAAGIVQKLGRNVSGLKVGDRVFVTSTNSGSYAQYVVSDDTFVFPLHERLSFAQVNTGTSTIVERKEHSIRPLIIRLT
jgi:NADPH:quinone reductase-like Zn-dependent oxidoreductase